MKTLFAGLFLLLCAAVATAQSTTVSGTITDAGGQTWNNGTVTVTFLPNPNFQPSKYTWSGGSLAVAPGALSSSGTYSMSIPSNAAITPSGSKWSFTFCPLATSKCFSVTATVGGTTQTLNATPAIISIDLLRTPDHQLAYATTEISAARVGSSFFLIGTGPQTCNSVTGNTCTSWSNGPAGVTTLAGLTDVSLAAVTNNDVLTYVLADLKWENKQPKGVIPNFASTAAIYDFPNNAADTALDNGTVRIHGAGLINAKAFSAPALLMLEQNSQATVALAIENKLATNAGMFFVVRDSVSIGGIGYSNGQIYQRSGLTNIVPIINLGIPQDAGAIWLQPDGGSVSRLILGGSTSQKLGFYGYGSTGSTPPDGVTQQTVTGSRNGNTALASLLTGLANTGLIVDSTTAGGLPYRQGGYAPGTYTTSQVLIAVPVPGTVSFPANFSGSQAVLQLATTASTVFIINKIVAGTPTAMGNITCGVAATVCTFTSTGGLTQSMAIGDVFQVVAPASADATAAGLGFIIAGTQ